MQCFLLAVLVSAVSCETATGLHRRIVTGSIRYPDGSVVVKAKVWTADGPTTFSDAAGRYRIAVPAGGIVTIYARDGFTPGVAYAVTRSGSTTVSGRHADIVLDQATPI